MLFWNSGLYGPNANQIASVLPDRLGSLEYVSRQTLLRLFYTYHFTLMFTILLFAY